VTRRRSRPPTSGRRTCAGVAAPPTLTRCSASGARTRTVTPRCRPSAPTRPARSNC
jgi:hypothetical protein